MNSTEDPITNEQRHLNRISMLPLYDRLLKITFHDTVSAIEHCRNVCGDFGFTVKQEASANRNIYVYCSREGLPDSQRNPKPTPQRKRPSKRCDCRWRIVLSENDQGLWEFRKSMNPNASEHNHEMMDPSDMVKAWPPEVNDMINYLAQQRLQTHEIRDAVKQRFSMITWNERRFYNRLTEERKRIRQRHTADRAKRLILLSSQLAAVVAANEEWAHCVEGDLQRMFDNFCQLTRIGPEVVPTLVDLQQQQHETDQRSDDEMDDDDDQTQLTSPVKKRKTSTCRQYQLPPPPPSLLQHHPQQQKNAQCISFPGFNIYVRSHSLRAASSDVSSRRAYDTTGVESPPNPGTSSFVGHHHPFLSLSSPTSSSASSSSSSILFRQQHPSFRLTSPPPPQDFTMSHQPYPINTQLSYNSNNSNASNSSNMSSSFAQYSNDLSYAIDAGNASQPQPILPATTPTTATMFTDFCPTGIKEERPMYDPALHGLNNNNTTNNNMGRPNDHPSGTSFITPEPNVTTAAYY